MPEKNVKELKAKYQLVEASGRMTMDVPMITEDEEERVTVRVISIDEEALVNTLYYKEGQPIQNIDKEVLVLEQFAKAQGIKVVAMAVAVYFLV